MNIKVKKLWMGHVSARDYLLKKAIRNKEDLTVECGGNRKTYPYRSLKGYLDSTTNEPFKSKFNSQEYTLIDLPWESFSGW